MNTVPFLKTSTLAALIAFGAQQGFAQQQQGVSLGFGGGYSNGLYIGDDGEFFALPLVRYDSAAFSIGFPDGLRVTISGNSEFTLSGVLAPRLSTIDMSDAAELDGLDRETTFDIGLLARYDLTPGTSISFRAVTEISDEHGGSEVDLNIRQGLPLGGIPFFALAGARWQSDELSSYLYGVSATEATIDRAAYSAGDHITPYLGVGTSIPLTDQIRLNASVRAEFLPDEVTNSSIVDEDVSVSGIVGIAYTF